MKINQSIALVTGANRGIGKAIVEELLSRGASKVYAGVRNPDSAQPLVAQYGDRVVPSQLDVTVIGVYPGPVDTDMAAEVDMPKTSPVAVAGEILDGVESGTEDVFPDDMARDIQRQWGENPKQLENQVAAMAAAG